MEGAEEYGVTTEMKGFAFSISARIVHLWLLATAGRTALVIPRNR